MSFTSLKRVTIIAEEILRDQIQSEGLALGASGYSSIVIQGSGSRGARHGMSGGNNAQIDFIVQETVAVKILNLVAEKYFAHYACIAWMSDVSVVHGESYLSQPSA